MSQEKTLAQILKVENAKEGDGAPYDMRKYARAFKQWPTPAQLAPRCTTIELRKAATYKLLIMGVYLGKSRSRVSLCHKSENVKNLNHRLSRRIFGGTKRLHGQPDPDITCRLCARLLEYHRKGV